MKSLDHIISGNKKDGFLLKCVTCEKEWFTKGYPNKNCSKECFRTWQIKFLKENNPMKDSSVLELWKLINKYSDCNEKRRQWTLKNNPMNKPEVREKHKNKMKTLSGNNNPLYTNPNALENLRKAQRSEEMRTKRILISARPDVKEKKRNYMKKNNPMFKEEIRLKYSISRTRPHDIIKEYIEYSSAVWQETNRSLITHKKDILKYELRGRKHGYDLDHQYSIFKGFEEKIDPKIIGHWKNLEIITGSENYIKHTKCSITIEELLKLIKESEKVNE